MDPITLLATLDALLTATERISGMVADYRRQGLIPPAEQDVRITQIEAIRAKVFAAEQ